MAATGAHIRVPVAVAFRILGFSTRGYYKWLNSPVSQRDFDDAHVIKALQDIHRDDPPLGYRFLTDELEQGGITAFGNRVWRLCSAAGIVPFPLPSHGQGWQTRGDSTPSVNQIGAVPFARISELRFIGIMPTFSTLGTRIKTGAVDPTQAGAL